MQEKKNMQVGDDIVALRADLDVPAEWIDTIRHPEALGRMVAAFNADEQRPCTIAPSKHGLGLFANRRFTKGDVIGVYYGPQVRAEVADDLSDAYDRCLAAPDPQMTILGNWMSEEHFNYVSFINDPGYGGSKSLGYILPPQRANVKAIADGDQVFVVATATIKRGDELFMFYGDPYWADHPTYYPEKRFRPTLKSNTGRLVLH